ncbi:MAG: methyltransferase domain-containing protein [Actinomycetota bacterium]|nr:methyltransferase domain-containing protein [Actinomycetota bacterium]
MTIDPQSGVELLGDPLSYLDGAEDELGVLFGDVADRSSSSDALASRIHDWPTRYHLSRQRSNLLRPLSIRPGMRVLDVGAGTGALARYLGEEGADVVALEGSLSRARAAAVRCDGLPNVRVVCGSVTDLEPGAPFDLVVVVGVLEYASHMYGGGLGATSFLAAVRRLTAPDGVVALAIENQLGLKYLLGGAEDHLGIPWVGVEGYRAPGGIRTYSRGALARLLAEAGLPPQRWLYPSPDYKLPSVVLADRCFAEPDVRSLIDQLIRTPVVDHAHPRERVCDDRAAADTFVEAGLGEEVANSFLVIAGDASAADHLVDAQVLAWHFGSERLSMWLRTKKVVERGGIRMIVTIPRLEVARERGWLSQSITATERFVVGRTLERLALDALAQHDIETLADLLKSWHASVLSSSTAVEGRLDPIANPFCRPCTSRLLPGDHLDIDLANFVQDGDARLHYVDREWCALGGVDLDLAVVRALWNFAYYAIAGGAELPWTATTTVDELTVVLGSLCGLTIGPSLLEDWRTAEDSLQELVSGSDRAAGAQRRIAEGQLSRVSFPAVKGVPFTTLRRDVVRLRSEIDAVRHEVTASLQRAVEAEKELGTARTQAADIAGDLQRARQQIEDTMASLSAARAELEQHRARVVQFERRFVVRLYRRLSRRPPPL